MAPLRFAMHGGTPGSPVGPLLAGGVVLRSFQEPPGLVALRAVSLAVCLPPGKARLRRLLVVISESD